MALVVEDGSGKADAESYCSVADADAYHVALGGAAWADLETADKEVALRKATRYLDGRYRWAGARRTSEQALAWPRLGVVYRDWLLDDDVVPVAILRACAELALLAQTNDIAPTGAPDGAVVSETVGPLSVTYASGRSGATTFRSVDQLLAGLTAASATVERS